MSRPSRTEQRQVVGEPEPQEQHGADDGHGRLELHHVVVVEAVVPTLEETGHVGIITKRRAAGA
jgi:hypothetical protein